jgi:hypothetical protein
MDHTQHCIITHTLSLSLKHKEYSGDELHHIDAGQQKKFKIGYTSSTLAITKEGEGWIHLIDVGKQLLCLCHGPKCFIAQP